MQEERDFKGVWIPREVWLDTRLNALDKVILTEIDSLDNGERGCYASNKYLAGFCQCSETKVSTAISKLIQLGYIYVQKFDGRQRELKSRLSNFERQDLKDCKADSQILKESNINNNTSINKDKKKDKKKERKETSYDAIISEFTTNEALKAALYEFIKMRKLIKKPMTDRALALLLNKLKELSNSDQEQIAILEQSIINNWQGVYPLKSKRGANGIELAEHEQPKEFGVGTSFFDD